MPQGKLSLTKPERSKPKHVPRGDQQKLRKGDRVFKAKIAKKQDEMRASNELTKKIVGRIEATMAARASTDGAGLSMLKPDESSGAKLSTLRAPVLSKKNKR